MPWREVFEHRIISSRFWPTCSPNLNPCDFYLWGTVKQTVYRTTLHSIEELKENSKEEIFSISQE
jgi:hypothetical protein